MYYEKLALEVGATVAGLTVVKPARITGNSGVEHKFTFVAGECREMYGFDVFPEVGQVEMLRAYVKKMDTDAKVYVICLSGRPNDSAKELAKNYGIEILGPREVGDFFSKRIALQIEARRVAATS
jgi:hypothetical protein